MLLAIDPGCENGKIYISPSRTHRFLLTYRFDKNLSRECRTYMTRKTQQSRDRQSCDERILEARNDLVISGYFSRFDILFSSYFKDFQFLHLHFPSTRAAFISLLQKISTETRRLLRIYFDKL